MGGGPASPQELAAALNEAVRARNQEAQVALAALGGSPASPLSGREFAIRALRHKGEAMTLQEIAEWVHEPQPEGRNICQTAVNFLLRICLQSWASLPCRWAQQNGWTQSGQALMRDITDDIRINGQHATFQRINRKRAVPLFGLRPQ